MSPRSRVSDATYEQSLADYAVLNEREIPAELLTSRIEYTATPLAAEDSELDVQARAVLERHGFLPVAHVRAKGPFLENDTEWWVDAHGTLVMEYALAPAAYRGKHFLSTYYSDGTAVSVGPSDTLNTESDERRVRFVGVDDLELDIATAAEDRARRASDVRRPLLAVDIETVDLRNEFFSRHFPPDLRILLQMDAVVRNTTRKQRSNKAGWAVIGVLLLVTWLSGWPKILLVGTAVITLAFLLSQARGFFSTDEDLQRLSELAEAEATRLEQKNASSKDRDS